MSAEVDVFANGGAALVVFPQQLGVLAVAVAGEGTVDCLADALAVAVVGVGGLGAGFAETDHAGGIVVGVVANQALNRVAGGVVAAGVGGAAKDLLQAVAVEGVAVGFALGAVAQGEAVAHGIVAVAQVAVGAAGAGQAVEFVIAEELIPAGVEQVLPLLDVAHRVVLVAALQDAGQGLVDEPVVLVVAAAELEAVAIGEALDRAEGQALDILRQGLCGAVASFKGSEPFTLLTYFIAD